MICHPVVINPLSARYTSLNHSNKETMSTYTARAVSKNESQWRPIVQAFICGQCPIESSSGNNMSAMTVIVHYSSINLHWSRKHVRRCYYFESEPHWYMINVDCAQYFASWIVKFVMHSTYLSYQAWVVVCSTVWNLTPVLWSCTVGSPYS